MKIETLKKDNLKRNIVIGVFIVLIISAVILQFTRAKYKSTASVPIVDSEVNYVRPDLNIVAIYVDGKNTSTMPNGNYILLDTSYCTINGENANVTLLWDQDNKALSVTPFTTRGTKCYLYFEEVLTAAGQIEDLYASNTSTMAYDDAGNLRYIGADPNNYVSFNGELWRIIGVFSEDTHGISGQKLIKLIRSESLGSMAWNSANTNDWSTASLQATLNGDYLNGTGSYALNGIKNTVTRSMIETVTWKLGGTSSSTTADTFYSAERGTTVYNGRPTEWSGKVALMYPSDYGYATSGGSITSREVCLSQNLSIWDELESISDCKNNDWLLDSNSYQWTLTSHTSYPTMVYDVGDNGGVGIMLNGASYSFGIRPSIYLKSDIAIMGGDGSYNSPYELSSI